MSKVSSSFTACPKVKIHCDRLLNSHRLRIFSSKLLSLGGSGASTSDSCRPWNLRFLEDMLKVNYTVEIVQMLYYSLADNAKSGYAPGSEIVASMMVFCEVVMEVVIWK